MVCNEIITSVFKNYIPVGRLGRHDEPVELVDERYLDVRGCGWPQVDGDGGLLV